MKGNGADSRGVSETVTWQSSSKILAVVIEDQRASRVRASADIRGNRVRRAALHGSFSSSTNSASRRAKLTACSTRNAHQVRRSSRGTRPARRARCARSWPIELGSTAVILTRGRRALLCSRLFAICNLLRAERPAACV